MFVGLVRGKAEPCQTCMALNGGGSGFEFVVWIVTHGKTAIENGCGFVTDVNNRINSRPKARFRPTSVD